MRFFFICGLLSVLGCHSAIAQSSEMNNQSAAEAVNEVFAQFVTGGDQQDTTVLSAVLHPTYRLAINQFMGGKDVTLIDRTGYLGMIAGKKIGGEPRIINIHSTEVVGNFALIRAELKSSTLRFESLFTFVRDTDGRWWLSGDTPFVTPL